MLPKSRTVPLFVLSLLAIGACAPDREGATTAPASDALAAAHAGHGGKGIANGELTVAQKQGVAAVRAATARYHDIRKAIADGYSLQWPAGCFETADGAQAYHFVNTSLRDDGGALDLARPELLMYEAGPNGTAQLIGVDYYISGSDWRTGATAQSLLDVPLGYVPPLDAYTIHIWAWRPNVNGMFSAWNPAASCRYALPDDLLNP
jgi:hypothetical protein